MGPHIWFRGSHAMWDHTIHFVEWFYMPGTIYVLCRIQSWIKQRFDSWISFNPTVCHLPLVNLSEDWGKRSCISVSLAHGGSQNKKNSRKLSGWHVARRDRGTEDRKRNPICFHSDSLPLEPKLFSFGFSASSHQPVGHVNLGDPEHTHFNRIKPLFSNCFLQTFLFLSVLSICITRLEITELSCFSSSLSAPKPNYSAQDYRTTFLPFP